MSDNNKSDSNDNGSNSGEKSRFYKKSFFMPFGIYNTDKKAPGRATEVLIGRNNERASFIRRLLNSGKGGAYLITGQRGTGKTSFVEHCMEVYEQDTVQRFANSTLAKTFTDKLMSIVFVFVLLGFPLVLSALLSFSNKSMLAYAFLGIPLFMFFLLLAGLAISPIRQSAKMELAIERSEKRWKEAIALDEPKAQLKSDKEKSVEKKTDKKSYNKKFRYPLAIIVLAGFVIANNLIVASCIFLAILFFKPLKILLNVKKPSEIVDFRIHYEKNIKWVSRAKSLVLSTYCWILIAIFYELPFFAITEWSIFWFFDKSFASYPLTIWIGVIVTLLGAIAAFWSVLRYEDKYIVQSAQRFIRNQILQDENEKQLPECFSHEALKKITDGNYSEYKKANLKYLFFKRREIYKYHYLELFKTSWLGTYLGVWKPTLTIKINLGFDVLEHANIVYGLLKQLHKKYHEAFLSFSNVRVISTRAFVFILFLALSGKLGDMLFAFDDVKSVKERLERPNGSGDIQAVAVGRSVISQFFGFQLYATQHDNSLKFYTEVSFDPTKLKNTQQLNCNGLCNNLTAKDSNTAVKRQTPTSMENSLLFYLFYVDLIKLNKGNSSDKGGNQKSNSVNNVGPSFVSESAFYLTELFLSKQVFPFYASQYDLANTTKKVELGEHNILYRQEFDVNSAHFGDVYSIRAYHLWVFLFIGLVYLLVDKFAPILPYKANERKLRKVIDRLTSTRTGENGLNLGGVQVPIPFLESKTYQPLDSRDIEQHFLDVLASLSGNQTSVVSGLVSVPSPDITIIFDELDKLGSTAKEQHKMTTSKATATVTHSFEFARSNKIKELLSDLKNVIDSDYCRFILIGGRHLRDEWLADQTKRDQLLPSIFDKAIYLSSLLTDDAKCVANVGDNMLLTRIKEYISQQHSRAKWIFDHRYKDRKPLDILNSTTDKGRNYQRFASQEIVTSRTTMLFEYPNFADYRSPFNSPKNNSLDKNDIVRNILLNQFVKFLAYRSHGIPKRLNEVFGEAIMPFNRVFKSNALDLPEQEREKILGKCQDALYFNNIYLYRMQFVTRIYDWIESFLGRKLYSRDDKIVTAVFFITDYLLKFHTRAFGWDSLEKIDDIADINRAPDLRGIIYELVEGFSEAVLHPVLNGMYSFRFKSSISRELIYLSKLSPTDSAAFNFTLDESQALKDLYTKKLESTAGRTSEISAALGELHEYDQDYDAARMEYHKTIEIIDGKVERLLDSSETVSSSTYHSYMLIIEKLEKHSGQADGLSLSYIVDWAVLRLRLMLKIAMTFEHTRNFERAQSCYHEAHMLSRRLLVLVFEEKPIVNFGKDKHKKGDLCFFGTENDVAIRFDEQSDESDELDDSDERPKMNVQRTFFMAKGFNVLYQAVYAKAWLSEKQGSGVDTSMTILSAELQFYEKCMHYFSLKKTLSEILDTRSKGQFVHASFALTKAEFYNKAGDLCFFKGINLPEPEHSGIYTDMSGEIIDGNEKANDDNHVHGYLYQASYYYATCLNYLRYFNLYRDMASDIKYEAGHNLSTFSAEQLPSYPLVESASSMADMAEVIFARINFRSLLSALNRGEHKMPVGSKDPIMMSLKSGSSELFQDYIFSTYVYFDKWFKYASPAEIEQIKTPNSFESYQDKANKILKKQFHVENPILNLWTPKDKDTDDTNKTECGSEQNKVPVEALTEEEVKNFFDFWVGLPVASVEKNSDEIESKVKQSHKVIVSSGTTGCSIERTFCYIALIRLNVKYLKQAGRVEEAAYELRRAAMSLIKILDMFILLKTQRKYSDDNLGIAMVDWDKSNIVEYVNIIILHARSFIEQAAVLYRNKSARKGSHDVDEVITAHISSKLSLGAIKLCVATLKVSSLWNNSAFMTSLSSSYKHEQLEIAQAKNPYDLQEIIECLAIQYEEGKNEEDKKKDYFKTGGDYEFIRTIFQFDGREETRLEDIMVVKQLSALLGILEKRCVMKRYPVLNRLEMLEQMSLLMSQPKCNQPRFLFLMSLIQLKWYLSGVSRFSKEKVAFESKWQMTIDRIMENEGLLLKTAKRRLRKGLHAITKIKEPFNLLQNREANKKITVRNIQRVEYFRKTIEKVIVFVYGRDNTLTGSEFDDIYDSRNFLDKAINSAEEMLEIEEKFDSPHHFNPSQVGHACFRVADTLHRHGLMLGVKVLYLHQRGKYSEKQVAEKKQKDRLEKAKYFYIRAKEYFFKSQQMCTQRYEYYNAIGDMYYLYDDFNDRSVHHTRSIQMMGSTVAFAVEREVARRLHVLEQLPSLNYGNPGDVSNT